MKKRILISILLVGIISISTIMGTYAVIINVISENGVDKIVNTITIKDLLTDDNGNYNNTYYDVRNELEVNDMEMDILMDSNYLNDSLKIVLNNVVSYKLRNGTKLTNDNIYDMIVNDVNSDPTINNELKNKVINLYDLATANMFFVDTELLKEDYAKIEKFYQDEPKLLEHEVNIKDTFRYKKHTLSDIEEKLLSNISKAFGNDEQTYGYLTDSDILPSLWLHLFHCLIHMDGSNQIPDCLPLHRSLHYWDSSQECCFPYFHISFQT